MELNNALERQQPPHPGSVQSLLSEQEEQQAPTFTSHKGHKSKSDIFLKGKPLRIDAWLEEPKCQIP